MLQRTVEFAQYTSIAFGERCRAMSVRPPMGTVVDAYDDAIAESFFARLECELIERCSFLDFDRGAPGAVFLNRGLVQPPQPAERPQPGLAANFERKHRETPARQLRAPNTT